MRAIKPFGDANWSANYWDNGQVAFWSPETFPDSETAGRFAHDFMNRTGTFNTFAVPANGTHLNKYVAAFTTSEPPPDGMVRFRESDIITEIYAISMEQAGHKLTEYLNTNKVEAPEDKPVIGMFPANEVEPYVEAR
jgi:hypothetical protein